MKIKKALCFLFPLSALLYSKIGSCGAPYVSAQFGSGIHVISIEDGPDNEPYSRKASRIGAGYLWDKNCRLKYGLETGITFFKDIDIYTFPYIPSIIKMKMTSLDVLGVLNLACHIGYGNAIFRQIFATN